MAPSYIITEPVPSTTSYMRAGRGGAGNTFRASASTQVQLPSLTATTTSQSTPRRFFSGVGGAGNVHEATERPAISLDDQFRRLAAREENVSELGHCGIGGAGNVYRRKESDASSAVSSDDGKSSMSSSSSRSKLWARLTNKA